jgi:hypothetical protein
MVLPFKDTEPGYGVFPFAYFSRGPSGWQTSMEKQPEASKGDCNGDFSREPLWGSRCSNSNIWYHLPGIMKCNTLSEGLFCSQPPIPNVKHATIKAPGLKAFRPDGEMLYIARGAKLYSYKIDNIESPVIVDNIAISGEVSDMELWNEKIILACDDALVIDYYEPSRPPVTIEAGHPLRRKSATHYEPSRPPPLEG